MGGGRGGRDIVKAVAKLTGGSSMSPPSCLSRGVRGTRWRLNLRILLGVRVTTSRGLCTTASLLMVAESPLYIDVYRGD